MNRERFDSLATSLGSGSTRRSLFGLLAAVPLAGVIAGVDTHEGSAKRKHHKKKRKGNKHTKKKKVFSVQISFTGSQLIPNNQQTHVQFNTIDHDQRGSVDLANGLIRAPFSGTFLVNSRMGWNGSTPGQRQALLVKNGTTIIAAGDGIAAGGGFVSAANTTVSLAAGDTISLDGLQNSGAPVDVSSAQLSVLLQRK
jgi:hypothetical protein